MSFIRNPDSTCIEKLTSNLFCMKRSKTCVDTLFQTKTLSIDKIAESGWDRKLLLGFGRWRATWSDKDHPMNERKTYADIVKLGKPDN